MKSANVVVQKLKVTKPEQAAETVEATKKEINTDGTVFINILDAVKSALSAVLGPKAEVPGVPGTKEEEPVKAPEDKKEETKAEDPKPEDKKDECVCDKCGGSGKAKKAEDPKPEDDKKAEEPAKPEDKKEVKAEDPQKPEDKKEEKQASAAPKEDLSVDAWKQAFGFRQASAPNARKVEWTQACDTVFDGDAFSAKQ